MSLILKSNASTTHSILFPLSVDVSGTELLVFNSFMCVKSLGLSGVSLVVDMESRRILVGTTIAYKLSIGLGLDLLFVWEGIDIMSCLLLQTSTLEVFVAQCSNSSHV